MGNCMRGRIAMHLTDCYRYAGRIATALNGWASTFCDLAFGIHSVRTNYYLRHGPVILKYRYVTKFLIIF